MNANTQKKEIDLLDIWRLAVKRRWIIISLALVLAIIAAVQSVSKTPVYMAQASIMIEDPSAGMMNIDELLNQGVMYRNDFLGTYFNTQLKLLTSRRLGEQVARRLDLANRPELQGQGSGRRSVIQIAKHLLSFRWLKPSRKAEEGEELDYLDFQDRNSRLASYVMSGLRIEPIEETRLVNLNYQAGSPELAADIVNAIAEEFINFTIDMRSEATDQAQKFLDDSISQLKNEISNKQSQVKRYRDDKKIIPLPNETENTIIKQYQDTSNAYHKATLERVDKEVIYNNLRSLNIDEPTSVVDNPVIQDLRTQYSQAKVDFKEKGKTYMGNSPVMKNLSARIEGLRQELEGELTKAVETAKKEYHEALRKEQSLKSMTDRQGEEVQDSQSDALFYNSLITDVNSKQTLLNSMISKRDETLVSARLKGYRSSNIKIIDSALVPGGPMSKNTGRNVGMALLLGLFIGIGLSFFIEYVDNSVKDPEEIEEMTQLPSLGTIPFFTSNGSKKKSSYRANYRYTYGGDKEKEEEDLSLAKDIELINHSFPNLAIAEDYRTLRTSILFSHADKAPQVITFTSSFPQEGKSATVTNLAVSFSQMEKSVLIIDADLRRPRLHKVFDLQNLKGLSSFLTGRIPFEEAIQKTPIERLWMMTSGPHPPNPAELLDSQKMKELVSLARKKFDIILIDSPPLLAVIDPIILGSMSDATVLVVRQGKTTKKALMKAIGEANKAASSNIIGLVFNEVKFGGSGGYHSTRYGTYMEDYREEK